MAEKERWNKNRELGFGVGVSIPVSCGKSSTCGGFGLCAAHDDEKSFSETWKRHSDKIVSSVTMFDTNCRTPLAKVTYPLSKQEKAVLSLAAGGLTSEQIAYRLSLSRKTVEAYQVAARKKLRATNTTAAAAKATFYELI